MKEMASAGSITENLYNFKQYNSKIGLRFNEEKFHIQADFASGNIVRAYKQLYVDTGLQANGIHCGRVQTEHLKTCTLTFCTWGS